MKKTLTNNLGLKILALIIAMIVWMAVINISDPVTTTKFYDVPVTLKNESFLINQDKTYEILDDSNFVKVTVKAPRSVLSELDKNDFYIVADFSNIKGDNTVPITIAIGNDKIEDMSLDHDDLLLEVEDLVHKSFDVEWLAEGSPMKGYVLGDVESQPNSITVSGPASYVEKINKATVTLDITDKFESIQANCHVVLLDAEGEKLSNNRLTLSNDTIMVTADFDPTKTVDLKFSTTGTPAVGYGVIEITADPEVVTISGDATDIANISVINIPEEELDITGLDKELTKTINVGQYVPDELKDKITILSNGGNVDVTVSIKPVVGKEISVPTSEITVKNLQSGLGYVFISSDSEQLTSIPITVYGLEETLEDITAEDVKVTIDADGLWVGKQHVQAQVMTPTGTYTEEIWISMQLSRD